MKSPPLLSESTSYENYKKEVEIWQLLKVCTAKEEGPILFRTLSGKAKDTALKLGVDKIGSDNGVKLIIDELDKLFLADKNTRMFEVLEKFEQYKRPTDVSIPQFISEFQDLQSRVEEFKITYPTEVLGFKVLQAASLTNEQERIVKATIATGSFNFDSVIDQIKKVCGSYSNESNELPIIKQENSGIPSFYENESHHPDHFYGHESYETEKPYYGYPMPRIARGNTRGFGTNNRGRNFRTSPQAQYSRGSSYESRGRPPYRPRSKINPVDTRGNISKCRKCKSLYHWIDECPHATPHERSSGIQNKRSFYADFDQDTEDNIYEDLNHEYDESGNSMNDLYPTNKAFFVNKKEDNTSLSPEIYVDLYQNTDPLNDNEIVFMVGESFNNGIIDSGCPKTVCGLSWYENFIETLNEEEKEGLHKEYSPASFRFGDSPTVQSSFRVKLPLNFKGKMEKVDVDVVKSEVPLLLSKTLLKSAKAYIDFENDYIKMFGIEQPLISLSTGHYAIPIRYVSKEESEQKLADVVHFNMSENKTNKEIKQTIRKLHVQFNHAAGQRLIKLLKDAGLDDPMVIKETMNIENNCEVCKRYKKTPARPVVTFPLAREFNEVIQADLKTYLKDKVYFLHIIDHATRFSAASVIYSKKKEVVLREFFRIWIAIFGYPHKLLVDNGGEFVNEDIINMCENLNINMKTTPAESAWSNGLCEKYNGVIGEAVKKVQEEVKCSVEVALAWCVNAKNSLHTVHGFSPYQMVFGRNPNLPFALNNKPPALEGIASSEIIRSNLNALHKSRQEFIRMESCDKVRRALKARIRTHSNIEYLAGDQVYYKRDGEDRWRGPAKVICQEGSKVLLKTVGKTLISVHTCRLQLAVKQDDIIQSIKGQSQSDLVKESGHKTFEIPENLIEI